MHLKERINTFIYGAGVEPIPFSMLAVAVAAELINAMMSTSVFAYLPHLVKTFGISEVEVGKNVGLIASSQNTAAAMFGLVAGMMSDRYYKKYVFIASCLICAVTTFAFGFTTSFSMALLLRFFQGTSGILVVSQSMLFEICSDGNKAVGMAFSLSAYSAGLVLGPAIGGYLSFPAKKYEYFKNSAFFSKYTIFLPNIILSVLFVGLAFAMVFVHPKKYKRNLKNEDNAPSCEVRGLINKEDEKLDGVYETTNEESDEDSRFCQVVRNKNCLLACISFAMYAFVTIGFNELYPVWASTDLEHNGLALTSTEIGNSYMVAAIFLVVIQAFLLSKITRVFGPKKVYLGALLLQVVFYSSYPAIANINNKILMWTTLCLLILLTRISVGASFVGVAVIVNCSVSPDLLGTANGLATSFFQLSCAIAPTAFGNIYSWSLGNIKSNQENIHALGFPFNQYFSFFLMSAICIATAILVCVLKDKSRSDYEYKKL